MEILFIDLGIPATVEVTDLREIPPLLLKDFTVIPRQVSCLCEYVDSVVQVTDSSGHGFPQKIVFLKMRLRSKSSSRT